MKYVPVFISLAVLLTACGGQSYRSTDSSSSNSSNNNSTNNTGTTPNTNTDNNNSTTDTAAYSRSYTIVGARMGAGNSASVPSGSTVTAMSGVLANSILKIDVSANSTGSITSSGSPMYNQCVALDISIQYGDSSTVGATQTVYVPTDGSSTCYNGSTVKKTADFSTYLNQGHTGGITIKLSNAYSNTCGNYYYSWGKTYCLWQQLYYLWQFSGSITVHTDVTN